MKAPLKKTPKVEHNAKPLQAKAKPQFKDNRSQQIQMYKRQELAKNSPQVQQLKAIQTKANLSPNLDQATLDNSTAPVQRIIWKQVKALNPADYTKITSGGVSGGGVWMYILHHKSDPYYNIRVHYHAGPSRGKNTYTVRWANEPSGHNMRAKPWMKKMVNDYYYKHQQKKKK